MTIDVNGKILVSNAAILYYYKTLTKGKSLYGDIAAMAPHFLNKKKEDLMKTLETIDISEFFINLYGAARCVAERKQLSPLEIHEELPINVLLNESFIDGVTQIINELLDTNKVVKKK